MIDRLMSIVFWCSLLSIILMFAGHAWAGTLLGILVAAWLVLTVAAIFSLFD